MNLLDFEKKYKDRLESIEEWAYFRIKVGYFFKNMADIPKRNRSIRHRVKRTIQFIKNIFYGFRYWFQGYDYLFFSDSSQRKKINSVAYHRFFDETSKYVNKILLVERPASKHYKDIPKHSCVVSENVLTFMMGLCIPIAYLIFKDKKSPLEQLFNIEDINISYSKEYVKFQTRYYIYKVLLQVYKPKKVFLTCYYCYLPLVKACNELNIDMIEYQHGVISPIHFGYISSVYIHQNYLPKFLLSFGEQECLLENMLIPHIVPIGSFYLEFLRENFTPNDKLKYKIKDYEVVIGISMQDAAWERELVFAFLEEIASLRSEILYILIPRHKSVFPDIANNVYICDELDCYNVIMHCDIHMTLYSSCALEAPSLGIPNILLNRHNIVKEYYGDILNPFHTKYIKNFNDLNREITFLKKLHKEDIIKANQKVFCFNYQKRIKDFIQVYIGEKE